MSFKVGPAKDARSFAFADPHRWVSTQLLTPSQLRNAGLQSSAGQRPALGGSGSKLPVRCSDDDLLELVLASQRFSHAPWRPFVSWRVAHGLIPQASWRGILLVS